MVCSHRLVFTALPLRDLDWSLSPERQLKVRERTSREEITQGEAMLQQLPINNGSRSN